MRKEKFISQISELLHNYRSYQSSIKESDRNKARSKADACLEEILKSLGDEDAQSEINNLLTRMNNTEDREEIYNYLNDNTVEFAKKESNLINGLGLDSNDIHKDVNKLLKSKDFETVSSIEKLRENLAESHKTFFNRIDSIRNRNLPRKAKKRAKKIINKATFDIAVGGGMVVVNSLAIAEFPFAGGSVWSGFKRFVDGFRELTT